MTFGKEHLVPSIQAEFESFRKQRAGAFYTRMRDKAEERKEERRKNDNEGNDGAEYGEHGGSNEYDY